jgi:hypothetical protein
MAVTVAVCSAVFLVGAALYRRGSANFLDHL